MSQIDINHLLNQMRRLSNEVERPAVLDEAQAAESHDGFSDIMRNLMDKTSQTQQRAQNEAKSYETGDPNVSLTQPMIDLQKGGLEFR